MAPALVEHSAAKERNSTSKEYSKNCWSQFDLELYNFLRTLKTKTLPLIKRSSGFLEMNDSEKEDRQDISFAGKKNDMVSFKDLPIIAFPNLKSITYDSTKAVYKNGTLKYNYEKSSPIDIINDESTCVFPTKKITNKQDSHHITKEDEKPNNHVVPSSNEKIAGIADFLQQKKDVCGVKFTNLSKSLDKLNQRLKQLQSKNVFAHVASHVTNRYECKNSVQSNNCNFKSPVVNAEKSWEDLRKLRDMINLRTDDTDSEDYETHVCLENNINRRKKKLDENPPPPSEALHQWKIHRASISSQCSWLTMKISSLDEKISKLDELHELQKHSTKTHDAIAPDDEASCESAEDLVEDEICRRVLPFTDFNKHKYVKTKTHTSTPVYGCRCLPAVTPCYRCLHSQRQYSKDSRNERTSRLDGGFHSRLSYQNEVSLSFLLEEALRKQRINTKVTISKPTKKKKKQKIKEETGNNQLNEKQRTASKHPKSYLRSRSERQKYEELSRKRSSGLESTGHGGRSRKSRKLSESEESWKPSTPTELNSPFSQNLSSSAFFPLKRKKNSSGADYDINNIVIPYSMAASTRVERIQYKEIPTPGWRNAGCNLNESAEYDEAETTDDEAYSERHMRCEVNEKNKFSDCYRHTVVRRRPNHLSESTASGPPSPLVSEELRPAVTTPIDSPLNVAALLSNRLTNLILIPGEERDPGWPLRTYPLNPMDCAKLSIVTTSSINTPNECKPTNNNTYDDPITTSKHFSTSTHSSYSKYFDNSPPHTTLEESPPLPTPLYTPIDTPMPSPICSLDGESVVDGEDDPSKWTVREMPLDAVKVESQQQAQHIHTTTL